MVHFCGNNSKNDILKRANIEAFEIYTVHKEKNFNIEEAITSDVHTFFSPTAAKLFVSMIDYNNLKDSLIDKDIICFSKEIKEIFTSAELSCKNIFTCKYQTMKNFEELMKETYGN